jgi:hypothetical protein
MEGSSAGRCSCRAWRMNYDPFSIIENLSLLNYTNANNWIYKLFTNFNTLNAELNPTCHLLALLGAHHILHVSRISVRQCRVQFARDVV